MRSLQLQDLTLVSLGCLIGLFGQVYIATAETVAERFEQAMKKKAEYCATHKIDPSNRRCDILKLKPADPLATEEGRFAHSIKIPNPVTEDSGYTPSMTSEQYFDHLCKTEAGEFIYKTVENVGGIYQMRLRRDPPYASNHLYALEDPYGGPVEGKESENLYVGPARYRFLESSDLARREPEWKKEFAHPSYFSLPDDSSRVVRYFGYDGHEPRTMQKEYGTNRKSQFGYTWRSIVRPRDREFGVAGSEVIVLDLQTQEVLGVHRGYAKFEIVEGVGTSGLQWTKRCPLPTESGLAPQPEFIFKVLKSHKSSVN